MPNILVLQYQYVINFNQLPKIKIGTIWRPIKISSVAKHLTSKMVHRHLTEEVELRKKNLPTEKPLSKTPPTSVSIVFRHTNSPKPIPTFSSEAIAQWRSAMRTARGWRIWPNSTLWWLCRIWNIWQGRGFLGRMTGTAEYEIFGWERVSWEEWQVGILRYLADFG